MASIKITKGKSGWGGPLVVNSDNQRNKILSMTSAGLHPVTEKLAQLLNCQIVDGFKQGVKDDEVLVAVIDCGGTARCGVYPKKKIFTVNTQPVGRSGPLAQFITEEYYVSDVSVDDIVLLDKDSVLTDSNNNINDGRKLPENYSSIKKEVMSKQNTNIIMRIGLAMGRITSKFYEAGRETINMVINNVLPFMAFVSMLIGIILASGLGNIIANCLSPFAGSILGLIVISFVCTLPFLSPILGPGAVISQVIGILIGTQIGLGAIPVYLALPALFGINGQVGCDFVPVGLALAEAESETIECGVPAVFYSRMITGPLSVIIAYIFAIIFLR